MAVSEKLVDIVDVLRGRHATWLTVIPTMEEAAAEITRLRAEVETIKSAAAEFERWAQEEYDKLHALNAELLAAILNSDDAHWTPAMRAAIAK